jgi:hypothetical protein
MNVTKDKTPTFKFDLKDEQARLAELIIYVSGECAMDPTFGAIKLNKILWWSDFLAYGATGKPITGVEYQRLGNGPAPRAFMPVRTRLEREKAIAVAKLPCPNGRTRDVVTPLRRPDLSVFTAEQLDIVHQVIRMFWDKSARETSEMSHGTPWMVPQNGEGIPYEAVFLSDLPEDVFDRQRTRDLAKTLDWAHA